MSKALFFIHRSLTYFFPFVKQFLADHVLEARAGELHCYLLNIDGGMFALECCIVAEYICVGNVPIGDRECRLV